MLYGSLWIGTGYVRSWQRQADYARAVHPDGSEVAVEAVRQFPDDAVAVDYRDAAGERRQAVASGREAAAFLDESRQALDTAHAETEARLDEDLAAAFGAVFGDGAERVGAFADWYYAWGRPFDLLWRGAGSVASRVGRPGMETLGEAVGRDTSDYLMAQFTAQVLRPELRDPPLREGIRRALVGAHDRYLAAVRQQDLRFQLFLARRTTHLEAPADGGLKVAFDWDAQRWKAPTYLMEDRAFDGVRTLVTLGAGGTLGAAALGPAVDGLLAASLGRVAVRAAAGVATEVEAGTAGGAAGSWLPGAGTALGAAGGAAVALGVDYAWGRLRERSGRGELEARGDEALAAVRDAWQAKADTELRRAVEVWFADARAALGAGE